MKSAVVIFEPSEMRDHQLDATEQIYLFDDEKEWMAWCVGGMLSCMTSPTT